MRVAAADRELLRRHDNPLRGLTPLFRRANEATNPQLQRRQVDIDNFVGLQVKGGALGAGNQKLIVGPWGHGQLEEVKYPANSSVGAFGGTLSSELALRWFDRAQQLVPKIEDDNERAKWAAAVAQGITRCDEGK